MLAKLAVVGVCLAGMGESGEIRVEVRDPFGAPMKAEGRVENVAGAEERRFETDDAGAATIGGLEAGRYRLEARSPGFAVHTALVEVGEGETVRHAVRLGLAPAPTSTVTVVGATPLSDADRVLGEVPAPVRTATGAEIENSGALELSDFLRRRLGGVHVNEVQGNPMQPDLNYRGYTASPLLGTPQGLSIYLDGVRLNQPFGDIVSWDLIPRAAIGEVTLMPGSNPVFGLNTLGGALSIRTKDGQTHPGTLVEALGGSFGRKMATLEHGGWNQKGWQWYGAGNLFFEDGWRVDSPSSVRQFFGKLGRTGERSSVVGWVSYANNSLIGNGLQDFRLLERDYRSIYTKPDITANRSPMVNVTARHAMTARLSLHGNAYYRGVRTRTLNGDLNDDALSESVYQPNGEEREALAAAGYTGFPASGENAANTPFPSWRCIAQSLLREEPAEKCNGLLNRSASRQHNYGFAAQLTSFTATGGGVRNHFTAGGGYDGNRVDFEQSAQLGYLNADRSVTGVNSFADGVTGGEEDGVPFDTRVDLRGRIHTGSAYAMDTVTLGSALHVTLSGRYNRTVVDNLDRIRPAAGSGSLTGRHVFQRFNPAAGVTWRAGGTVNTYFGYSEGNRAPASSELGCADPEQPCKLPNAMAGDPPLNQVVTRTWEAGVRGGGQESRWTWSAGWFRADNRDDILFVSSEQSGFGYFKNFGKTRRQGLELQGSGRVSRVTLGGAYTLLEATFRSAEEVDGTGNSTNEEALEGLPGMEGSIEIEPGNRIPLIPRHLFKAYADVEATSKLLVDVGVVAASSSFARGNENNRHQPDGLYYLGAGSSAGYAVVNAGARYELHRRVQLVAQVNNLLNRRHHTAAQLGATGFTADGRFVARPLPAIDGEFPLPQSTFLAPGAPRGAWAGVRFRF